MISFTLKKSFQAFDFYWILLECCLLAIEYNCGSMNLDDVIGKMVGSFLEISIGIVVWWWLDFEKQWII